MAHYNLGYCYFNNENMEQAAKSFDTFLKEYGKRDAFRADAMNRRGDIHYSAREFSAAMECYDRTVAMRVGESDYAEYQRAITLGVQNKRTEKITALNRIVSAGRGEYVMMRSMSLVAPTLPTSSTAMASARWRALLSSIPTRLTIHRRCRIWVWRI